jgi:pimeloyl-ACP methyl ester carboxylesterase
MAKIWASVMFALAFHIGQTAAGTLSTVTFSDYTMYSSNAETSRRVFSPLALARLPSMLAAAGAHLAGQPVNLSTEHFVVYVPATMPARGYGLLVFVPPWDEAELPPDWDRVLDERGLIYVSAERSGNDQSVLGRRLPLAVLAEQNVALRYRIDPERVFVSGFSGGSRVALRVALAYPDIFGGAILDAGADPIGTAERPLPPRDLFERFARETRLVFIVGDQDLMHVGTETTSRHSLEEWCVSRVQSLTMPSTSHALADAHALSRALDALENLPPFDPSRVTPCLAAKDAEITAKLKDVEAMIASGNRAGADQVLRDVDDHYGGLAAPTTVELLKSLQTP